MRIINDINLVTGHYSLMRLIQVMYFSAGVITSAFLFLLVRYSTCFESIHLDLGLGST